MARARPLFPIALSPQGVADAIGVDLKVITAAMKSAELACYQRGRKQCIPVMAVVTWCAAGGPSAYTSKGDPGAVHR